MKRISLPLFSKEFFGNSIVHWLIITVVFLNLISWTVLAVYARPVDFPVFLRYNIYLGVDTEMTGEWKDIFLLPLAGTIFLALNLLLAFHFFSQKERIASYVLLLAAIMVQVAVLVAGAAVILINY